MAYQGEVLCSTFPWGLTPTAKKTYFNSYVAALINRPLQKTALPTTFSQQISQNLLPSSILCWIRYTIKYPPHYVPVFLKKKQTKNNSIQRHVKIKTAHSVCVSVIDTLVLGSPKYFQNTYKIMTIFSMKLMCKSDLAMICNFL